MIKYTPLPEHNTLLKIFRDSAKTALLHMKDESFVHQNSLTTIHLFRNTNMSSKDYTCQSMCTAKFETVTYNKDNDEYTFFYLRIQELPRDGTLYINKVLSVKQPNVDMAHFEVPEDIEEIFAEFCAGFFKTPAEIEAFYATNFQSR